MSDVRCALITGSGRNIGRAIALELAARGFGIVLNGSTDRQACQSVADEIAIAGGESVIAMGDIGIREQAQAIASTGIDRFGAIDVLINNAAIRPNIDFLDSDEDEWDRIYNINFKSTYWLARACLPGMIDKGWGRVIHFTGMNAQQGYPGKSAVSVSKHACWGLTKSLAKEFGQQGITTNIISPGTIIGETANAMHDGKKDELRKNNPSGRLGVPHDIASAIGLLVSDEGGFINGQLLQVNGGVVT